MRPLPARNVVRGNMYGASKMNRTLSLLVVGGMLATATPASAGQQSFFKRMFGPVRPVSNLQPTLPTLDFVSLTQWSVPPAPAVEASGGQVLPTPTPIPTVQLYPLVQYKDLHNIHPCAVTKIVKVLDPCYKPCACSLPKCVYVQICVPPCGCPDVKVKKYSREVEYDYGRYEVEIKSKNGILYVDYDD